MREIPENAPEQSSNVYLSQLREAFDAKDKNLLRTVVDSIQTSVHGMSKTPFSTLPDRNLLMLLETGEGMINVGTGTAGQRIYIKNRELYMPAVDAQSERYARQYRINFRYLFDIPDNEEDLRVRF